MGTLHRKHALGQSSQQADVSICFPNSFWKVWPDLSAQLCLPHDSISLQHQNSTPHGSPRRTRSWKKKHGVVSKCTCWEDKGRQVIYGHSPSHLQVAFMWKYEQTYSVPAVSATALSPPILRVLMPLTFCVDHFSSHFKYFSCHQGFLKTMLFGNWLSFIHSPPACEQNANFWWIFTAVL